MKEESKKRIEKNSMYGGQLHYWEVITQAQGSDQSIINIFIIPFPLVHLN